MKNILYHNPHCSKSREALHLLQENNIPFEIRDYLNTPPTSEEITTLCEALACTPYDVVRHNNLPAETTSPPKNDHVAWIKLLIQNPALLQRPIVRINDKCLMARPPEKLLELL